MQSMRNANVEHLLHTLFGESRTATLFATLNHPALLNEWEERVVTRAELAQALNMALFEGLLACSPNGRAYTQDTLAAGGSVYFEHGALPSGAAAFARILRPLGFRIAGRYSGPRKAAS
jgi:hypothetical protein